VTGDVTYDGKPVEYGSITFTPADGKGQAAGAVIEKGHYTAAKVPPGSKVVRIEAYPTPSPPGSSDQAKGAKGSGRPVRLIPTNAEGNNATVDVKPGENKHDFNLNKPGSKSG
jgi:hypothetical protein